MSILDVERLAAIELEERRRRVRAEQGPRFDWYGDECACGKALGECREHPRARPSQRPPGSRRASESRSDWRIWMLRGGRGFGKSVSAANFVVHEVEGGRVGWVALVGATAADVRDYQIEHPYSGLIAVSPPWFKPTYEPSKRRVTWPNGAYATIFTSEEPEGLRGGGFNLAWVDELAKWSGDQQYTWDMLEFALRERTEPRPRVVVSTTPRPTPTYFAVRDDPRTVVTGGPMRENAANLDPDFVRRIEEKYRGTRLGRQELDAEDDLEVPGALWTQDMIDQARLWRVSTRLVRVVVAIDPNAGSADPESGAETGIVVAARGSDGHGYVLADATCKGSPETWGKAALKAYEAWQCDRVIGEKNNGGDMVEHVVRTVPAGSDHPAGALVPYKAVWASRGKAIRAEPVASLYEQRRVHHIGEFRDLERQMCSFIPTEDTQLSQHTQGHQKKKKKPKKDRMDALVWALTEVMLGGGNPGTVMVGGRRA